MARGFPLQDDGPGMNQMFGDLQTEQLEQRAIAAVEGEQCECRRPKGQCVKGDMDRCPAEDEDDASMECPACGGSTITVEGFDCEECNGMGRVSL